MTPHEDELLRIGARLCSLREAAGYTQESLAAAAGVSLGTITKMEQGERWDIKVSTLAKLADVLGTSLDYLATGRTVSPEDPNLSFAAQMVQRYGFSDEKASYVLQRLEQTQFSDGDTPDTIAAAIKMAERDYNAERTFTPRPAEVVKMRPGLKRRKPRRARR